MLYIIANRFSLTSFLLDRLDDDSNVVKILHPLSPKGVKYSLSKLYESLFLRNQTSSNFYPSDYISSLQKIKPEDSVLIFGVENIKELIVLKRFIQSRNISLFTWNPVIDYQQSKISRKIHIGLLKKLRMKIYTFDPGDAQKYELTLINQVYRDVSEFVDPSIEINTDVYFIGQDKGRLSVLKNWLEIFQSKGISANFHIFKEKKIKYSPEDLKLLSDKYISYLDNIKIIQSSHCLFELMQKNQSGQTIRSLESAFFQKKLITNNLSIKQSSLYDPDRVFIIGEDNPESVGDFLKKPYKMISDSVLHDYDLKYWMLQFERDPHNSQ